MCEVCCRTRLGVGVQQQQRRGVYGAPTRVNLFYVSVQTKIDEHHLWRRSWRLISLESKYRLRYGSGAPRPHTRTDTDSAVRSLFAGPFLWLHRKESVLSVYPQNGVPAARAERLARRVQSEAADLVLMVLKRAVHLLVVADGVPPTSKTQKVNMALLVEEMQGGHCIGPISHGWNNRTHPTREASSYPAKRIRPAFMRSVSGRTQSSAGTLNADWAPQSGRTHRSWRLPRT
jgi:hypothetical protein